MQKNDRGSCNAIHGQHRVIRDLPAEQEKKVQHSKKMKDNVTQPLELVYTDNIGPSIYRKSLDNFHYISIFVEFNTQNT